MLNRSVISFVFACALIISSNTAVAQAEATSANPVPGSAVATLENQQMAKLDDLFFQLANADDSNWEALETEIWEMWSRSGSAAMDLLLERGRSAMMDEDDIEAAIDHLTALTDHAPRFAEGWNARATAFYLAGELGPSLDDISRTLALEPRHFGALSGLGIILEEMGEPERALEAYRFALAINPQNPDIKEAVSRLDAASARDI